MREKSKKVNAKLYKVQDSIVENAVSVEDFISEMIANYSQSSGNDFINVNLKRDINSNNYRTKLFVFNTPQKPPQWINFLESIVENITDISALRSEYSAFLLFVYTNDKIFVLTKGYYGHHLLDEYLDRFFGLDVLSRLVDKSVTEIKQIEERGVFGIEIGAQRFFRDNYNLSYEDDFGKIYKTMLASISEDKFERLGIIKKREDVHKISVNGSASFEVSTNFDFDELISRIKKIESLLEEDGVQFNQFYRVPTSELTRYKDELNERILDFAYEAYLRKEPIDFYHPNALDYLRSNVTRFNVLGDFVEIPYGSSMNFIETIDKLISENIFKGGSKEIFIGSLRDCCGGFKINENEQYTNDLSLDKWIGGEVQLNGQKYFKIDNVWYKYKDGFESYLNRFIEGLDFNAILPRFGLPSWDFNSHSRESDYNLQFKTCDDFIVADRAFYKNIELSDLIRITDTEIYLYHIKKGLGRDLRVLINQIVNASRTITFALNGNDNSILSEYYDSIARVNYSNGVVVYHDKGTCKSLTKDEFVNHFKTKRIIMVLAYSSNSSDDIKNEIISTNSSIAKLSLIYCIRDIQRTSFKLLIERIVEE